MADDDTITYKVAVDTAGAKAGADAIKAAFQDLEQIDMGMGADDLAKFGESARTAAAPLDDLKQSAAGAGEGMRKTGDDAKAAASGLETANEVAQMLSGGLSGLAEAAGVGGLLALGKQAVEVGTEFLNLGDELQQNETRLRAFAGGTGPAEAALNGMNGAVGRYMTTSEQAATASTMLELNLASTGDEMGRLAEIAIYTGDAHESAQQRVDSLMHALVTGRAQSLIPYGINVQAVQDQVDALKASHVGLTDKAALTQVALQVLGDRTRELKDANYQATTSMQDLATAAANLKDTIAGKLNPALKDMARALTDIVVQGLDWVTNKFEAAGVATANMANANDVGTASFYRLGDAATSAEAALEAARQMGPTAPTWGGPGFAPVASGAPGTPGTETDAWLKAMTQEQTALDRGRTATAVSDWKSATDTMANAFTTFIDKGNKWLDKLLGPGVAGGAGGDITAPGANGPLEGIYRVADVLKNWAKPGVDTAKFAAQYYPGQSMAQAGASAAVNIGQYRAGDLAPLYKAGILNETAVNAAALTPSQLAMTGVTGTLPLGAATAAAGAVKTTGQPQQPQAGIAQGLQGMDLATPLVSTLNALQKNADFLTASNGVGTAMAKNMAAAWVKELPNTPWAGAMEKAIMTDILNAFPKK